MRKVRAVFISDLHLGSDDVEEDKLVEFLDNINCEKLYLVGDIIDRKNSFSKNKVYQKLIEIKKKGIEIIYIRGNHEQDLNLKLKEFQIYEKYTHLTKNGDKFLVIHGHQFDLIKKYKILNKISILSYKLIVKILKKTNKNKLKINGRKKINFLFRFEKKIANFCKKNNFKAVVCGHSHIPKVKKVNGVYYYNCGDWTYNCSYIVEKLNGEIKIYFY